MATLAIAGCRGSSESATGSREPRTVPSVARQHSNAEPASTPKGVPAEPTLARALLEAVDSGDCGAVATLLARGASADCVIYREPDTYQATTPLCAAAEKGDAKMVRVLLEAGASPSLPSLPAYIEPLHIAAQRGDAATASLLIAAGADPLTEAKHGITPLQLARRSGSRETLELLEERAEADEATAR